MDAFTPKERALNFSSNEKIRFQGLIEKYKDILFNKKTDNVSNIKKNKIWASILAEFNAGGDQPRSLKQLKAKFDNMKRNARKDASKERQVRLRTGGGPPTSPVQPDTEWFRTVMPVSMDGLPSIVDDDVLEVPPAIITVQEPGEITRGNSSSNGDELNPTQDKDHKENVNPNKKDNYMDLHDHNVFDTKAPASLLRTPISKPLRIRRRSCASRSSLKNIKAEIFKKMEEQEHAIYELKLKHMEEKRKEEKEIFELKKKKLSLEISLLENKASNSSLK